MPADAGGRRGDIDRLPASRSVAGPRGRWPTAHRRPRRAPRRARRRAGRRPGAPSGASAKASSSGPSRWRSASSRPGDRARPRRRWPARAAWRRPAPRRGQPPPHSAGALRTAADRRALLHHQLLAVAGAAQRDRRRQPPARRAAHGPGAPATPRAGWPTCAPGSRRPASSATRSFLRRPGIDGDRHRSAGLGAGGLGRRPRRGAALSGHAARDAILWPATTSRSATRSPSCGRAHSDRFTPFDGNLAELAAEGVDLAPRRPTAPTALEAWARCPFAYFVRYLLGVRELDRLHEELSLRPADRGVLVHAVLETVVDGHRRRGDLPGAGRAVAGAGPGRAAGRAGRPLRRPRSSAAIVGAAPPLAAGAAPAPPPPGRLPRPSTSRPAAQLSSPRAAAELPFGTGHAVRARAARRGGAGPARPGRPRGRRRRAGGGHRLQDGPVPP